MYHAIVRLRVRQLFEGLRRDWRPAITRAATDVHHVFAGHSALGGERNSREAMSRWFERLERLYPGHDFEVGRVVVAGPPWRTTAVVEWTAQLRPLVGEPYRNAGTHWLTLRWGRATDIHAYHDTQAVAKAPDTMAAQHPEAGAEPIAD